MNNYFLFLIPRTPLQLRSPFREKLWELCKKSLLCQESKNWKAIIIGETKGEELDPNHFITLNYDNENKREKLIKALNFVENEIKVKPGYLIRLDDDDIFSTTILNEIESQKIEFDCYADKFHTYIDPIYLKISYSKGTWIPNTAIHKYDHAITQCGPDNEKLIIQDHGIFWHVYYSNKNIVYSQIFHPLYYRILSPTSITSSSISDDKSIDWQAHLKYLKGYGPWININKQHTFYKDLEFLSKNFFNDKPYQNYFFLAFNYLKFLKKCMLSFSNRGNLLIEEETFVLNNPTHSEKTKVIECVRCILSTKDVKNISFNSIGICNYCQYYDTVTTKLGNTEQKQMWIKNKVDEIKKNGLKKEFDCILGVSGGVDSTFLAYWTKENGLRPLVVHFDNGWNSELATENIQNICNKLGFSLSTYVINWDEFKELQLAYLKAGVVDIEVLTDHAIMATIYSIAKKYKLKYTISGFNYATEAIMPKGWVFDKGDWANIKDIYKKFGAGKSINSFPHISFYKKLYNHFFLKLESIQVLNYIPYNKAEAKKVITEKLNWRDYGGKHYESIFTKFYQANILPTRFGIDKRLAHYSNLICSKQITKEQALIELKQPLYIEADLVNEKEYVLKKLGLKLKDFDKLMSEPERLHTVFKTETKLWKNYFQLIRVVRFWKK